MLSVKETIVSILRKAVWRRGLFADDTERMYRLPYRVSLLRAVVFTFLVGGCVLAHPISGVAAPSAARMATVTFVDRGLQVQPTTGHAFKGQVKEPLFSRYGLRTVKAQRAAIGFTDGTTFHMNQQTDVTLTDSHRMLVKHGEIAMYLKPGSDHSVATQAALATAIGTVFDLQINGDDSTYIVVHGALQVQNRLGTVVVETNQESTAGPDQAPTQPKSVDGRTAIGWTAGLPRPNLGENEALAADGGTIVGVSSQDVGTDHGWDAQYVIDGLLQRGWRSAAGQVRNQSIVFGLGGGHEYQITDVILDPAATSGNPPAADLKHFTILASTTGTAPADFHLVASGTCLEANSLQNFHFPHVQPARYVELLMNDNYGGTQYIELAEAEIVALPM
jgi:hypothetical protein